MSARFNFLLYTSYQESGLPNLGGQHRFGRTLEAKDAPYKRPRFEVGTQWVELDQGWVMEPSFVTVENMLPTLTRIPTPEQKEETDARVVEVGVGGKDFAAIPPGESLTLSPTGKLCLRCRKGTAKVNLTVYPK